MLQIEHHSTLCCLSTADWRLVCERPADRWTHQLLRRAGTAWQPVWHSVEGTPADTWPDSPAFQDLFCESLSPECAEIQMLGQAGKTHYSAAIRWDVAAGTLDFDVAARIHREPPAQGLGSQYQLAADLPVQSTGATAVTALGQTRIVSLPDLRDPSLVIDRDANLWRVVPQDAASAMPDIQKRPQTVRWRYRWIWTDLTAGQ